MPNRLAVPAVSVFLAAALALSAPTAHSQKPAAKAASPAEALKGDLAALLPELDALYRDLHQTPELSHREEKTAAKMAERLRALGFEVTTGVGGHGVVGVLKNGPGPTVMVRTDLDALPVEEKTGLPYASRVRAKDPLGNDVSVMHACGHDLHMTAWVGTATLLSKNRKLWKGTLVMVGQPAEETTGGASGMMAAGLYTRFPKPEFALAIHDDAGLEAGKVSWTPGFVNATVDSVDVTIYGRGGHGAYPHTTVDPIVLAARAILALQTVVSRERDPLEPAVITVGSIHGGTKHNIIPDEVKLQLTVRSYKETVRQKLLSGIERILKAEALAAGAPKEPTVTISEGAKAVYNDPAVTKRLAEALKKGLGEAAVVEGAPRMGSEDFSDFLVDGVRGVYLNVGAVAPAAMEASRTGGAPLPSLHSPLFAPDRERTIPTAVLVETLAALELLGRP